MREDNTIKLFEKIVVGVDKLIKEVKGLKQRVGELEQELANNKVASSKHASNDHGSEAGS